jgi:hypothetical protein
MSNGISRSYCTKKKKKHGKEPRDTPVHVPGVQQAERIKLKKRAGPQETYSTSCNLQTVIGKSKQRFMNNERINSTYHLLLSELSLICLV